jgi:hypothetical protein
VIRGKKKGRKSAGAIAFIAYGNAKHLWNNDPVKWAVIKRKRPVFTPAGEKRIPFSGIRGIMC